MTGSESPQRRNCLVAKGTRSGNNNQRVNNYNANRRLTGQFTYNHSISPAFTPLTTFEDRRTYSPILTRPAASFSSPRAKITARSTQDYSPKFTHPESVLVCVRRGIRREVLHALKKTGRGSAGGRRRLSRFSNVSC